MAEQRNKGRGAVVEALDHSGSWSDRTSDAIGHICWLMVNRHKDLPEWHDQENAYQPKMQDYVDKR